MSKQQDASRETPDSRTPSIDRRRLLRAAVAAAPVMATLPNGAALANASARQCLIQDKSHSDSFDIGVDPYTFDLSDSIDGYVRFTNAEKTWRVRIGPGQFVFPVTYPMGTYPLDHPVVDLRGDPIEYKADGTIFVPNSGNGDTVQSTRTVYLLGLYKPLPESSDFPTTVDTCDLNGATQPTPQGTINAGLQCFWPVSERQTGNGGNMGISGSCLASVDG